jgi:cytochrome c nitrite reductase small subunit
MKALLARTFGLFVPPPAWRLPVIVLLGALCGLGLHVLHISRAFSYLGDEPVVCINCHIMIPQYATWQRGSHGRVSVCNDCHVPHDSILRKYAFKAKDGMRHAFMFTFRLEPQVIRIRRAGLEAVKENCIRCHLDLVQKVYRETGVAWVTGMRADRPCWECHRETPHGTVGSLSSTPFARVPRLEPVMPAWLAGMLAPEETSATAPSKGDRKK